MVEPVRYRKVIVEMMGTGGLGSPASSSDASTHILLTRDQELAISNAVEAYEKKCEELRAQREGICDTIKQHRVGHGSELENMRAFIQVIPCGRVLLLLGRKRSFTSPTGLAGKALPSHVGAKPVPTVVRPIKLLVVNFDALFKGQL